MIELKELSALSPVAQWKKAQNCKYEGLGKSGFNFNYRLLPPAYTVRVFVCLSVQALTFECLDIETSFLVWWDILTISRLSSGNKVIG